MKEMRRKDRKIDNSEAIEILNKGEYGILSMVSLESEGYGIPLNYAMEGNNIYFHCATEGTKLDYLKNNNKVSFCVVGKTELMPAKFGTKYESAIVFGITSDVGENEKREGLWLLIKKYSADFTNQGDTYIDKYWDRVTILKLSIESISGKARKQ